MDAGYLSLRLDSGQLISMGDKSWGGTFTEGERGLEKLKSLKLIQFKIICFYDGHVAII